MRLTSALEHTEEHGQRMNAAARPSRYAVAQRMFDE
jgi:hypothetical protein